MATRHERKVLAAQARHYAHDAVLFLKALMYGDEFFTSKDGRRIDMPAEQPASERAKAANAILDRSHGKPAQAVNFSDEDGEESGLINGQSAVDLLLGELVRIGQSSGAGVVQAEAADESEDGSGDPL